MNTGFHRIGSLSAVLRKVATAGVVGLPVIALVAAPAPARQPAIVMLPAGATGAEIQRALDALPAGGGEVVLPPGVFKVNQPIVLRRDHQELRGAGVTTVLYLADNANCPVVILGEPVNNPKHAVREFARKQICLLTATGNINSANSGGPRAKARKSATTASPCKT